MKITTVMGSPRLHGNTAAVLGLFESLAEATHQVERVNIVKHEVKGCLGCDACFKTLDAPGCVQRDDAVGIFERLMASDAIVYATPLYVWDFTAQMKAFIDRHYCLVKWAGGEVTGTLLKGKRAALLVTCGDVAEQNADLIQEVFEREMRYVGCEVAGKYIVPNCSTPDKLGEKGKSTARAMYEEICGENAVCV